MAASSGRVKVRFLKVFMVSDSGGKQLLADMTRPSGNGHGRRGAGGGGQGAAVADVEAGVAMDFAPGVNDAGLRIVADAGAAQRMHGHGRRHRQHAPARTLRQFAQGGLASGPTYIDTGPFTRFFQYQCNGKAAAGGK